MPWKICFELPPPTGQVCIDIPLLVRRWDDPRWWITSEFIDERFAKDLTVLATIDSLASRLRNATTKKAVQSAIQSGIDQKLLKQNAKIEFR